MDDLIERLRGNGEMEAAQEIAALRSLARYYLEYTDNLDAKLARALSQLRECAETLGADQIDEQRAMRAYADSVKLLDELKEK
ncbi:hypothetical protein LMG26685_02928 [Achromobacter mucicolens]|uniref:hypothetical protein n=1 Tax=Achromobacter mucicolens TaxID=1389922 RepID=UPI0009D360D0|nr:hypothetical protein [Achromobacter mucicolens]OXC90996.1 hypothetical protein BMR85_007290 [Achromobacter sp. KAs 3-5]CAB3654510.1 hypothetical protein LMG26685_02928 [Achromobacter mucicolens]